MIEARIKAEFITNELSLYKLMIINKYLEEWSNEFNDLIDKPHRWKPEYIQNKCSEFTYKTANTHSINQEEYDDFYKKLEMTDYFKGVIILKDKYLDFVNFIHHEVKEYENQQKKKKYEN